MNKKLEVKNLVISFRTINGKVQAVRDISFDLYEGDTLAIVGESGSGKSVTSKAIMGILAGNSIIEGGEIIYDGKDLLTLPEDEFCKIRGDKISMIFQDPLSSLNPIMKIGRQLTEAMLLKGKARQKESRASFNSYLALLRDNMIKAIADGNKEDIKELTLKCKNFDKFEYKHLELENDYNKAFDSATEASGEIDVLVFELSKNVYKDLSYRVNRISAFAKDSISTYVVNSRKEELKEVLKGITNKLGSVSKNEEIKNVLVEKLNKVNEILKEALAFDKPNFFTMGYFLTFANEDLPNYSIKELNSFLREYLDKHFMLEFISDANKALRYSADVSYSLKQQFVDHSSEYIDFFNNNDFTNKKDVYCKAKLIIKEVKNSIDRLEFIKDSVAYTFDTTFLSSINKYYDSILRNKADEKRYLKDKAKYDKLVARGKTPDWEIVPQAIIDLDIQKQTIVRTIERLRDKYISSIEKRRKRNFDNETVAVIDYLKECASGVVAKVSNTIAKNRALKLMEEVGISEPRRRYNQYPFEFSGGMRQRIVIAIALAANPDILICDEPTTALDVTIQAQILELINELKEKRKLAIIFITHDLGVVANMADRIAVMYAGKIVEYGSANDIFYDPRHPYTWALLSSMPDLDTNEKLEAIPGTPPNMIYPPVGDAFAERNKYALKIDFEMQPPMFKVSDNHYAATWLLHKNAPKVEPPKIVTERIKHMKKLNEENMKKIKEEK